MIESWLVEDPALFIVGFGVCRWKYVEAMTALNDDRPGSGRLANRRLGRCCVSSPEW